MVVDQIGEAEEHPKHEPAAPFAPTGTYRGIAPVTDANPSVSGASAGGTELGLVALALDVKGAARHDAPGTDVVEVSNRWVDDDEGRMSSSVSSGLTFPVMLGGGLGIVVLVILVYSVLTVSNDSKHRVVVVDQSPSTSATPTRVAPAGPTTTASVATPTTPPRPATLEPTSDETSTAPTQVAPPVSTTAQPAQPAPPSVVFPRLRQWFPRLFPNQQ